MENVHTALGHTLDIGCYSLAQFFPVGYARSIHSLKSLVPPA